jgi:hypothetical protein
VFLVVAVEIVPTQFFRLNGGHEGDRLFIGLDIIGELFALGMILLSAYLKSLIPGGLDTNELNETGT